MLAHRKGISVVRNTTAIILKSLFWGAHLNLDLAVYLQFQIEVCFWCLSAFVLMHDFHLLGWGVLDL